MALAIHCNASRTDNVMLLPHIFLLKTVSALTAAKQEMSSGAMRFSLALLCTLALLAFVRNVHALETVAQNSVGGGSGQAAVNTQLETEIMTLKAQTGALAQMVIDLRSQVSNTLSAEGIGGNVSGTSTTEVTSATALTNTGSWCGARKVAGFCSLAKTPIYLHPNVPCEGKVLAATCIAQPDINGPGGAWYADWASAPTNCPAGYTAFTTSGAYPTADQYGPVSFIITCIKN